MAAHSWVEQRPAAGSSVERYLGGRSSVELRLTGGNAAQRLAADSLENPGEDRPDWDMRNPDTCLALHSADSLGAGAFPGSQAWEMDAGPLRGHGTEGIAGWAGFGSEAADMGFADTGFGDALQEAARIGGGIPGAERNCAGRAKGVGDSDFD